MVSTSTSDRTEPDSRAAEAVLRHAFEAQAAMEWDSLAALMHPEALRRFHLAQIDRHRMRERYESRPAEERATSGMPAEVRAWFDEQETRHRAQHPSGVAADFARVSSVAELEALDPEAAYGRWAEAHDARAQLAQHLEATGQPLPPEVALAEMHPTNRIVGSVVEDDATVQVLHRTGLSSGADEGEALDRLAVATVRRAAAGWRIWTTEHDPQGFGIGTFFVDVELREECDAKLRELAGRTFSWPDGETPRVRASVQGYAADAPVPEAVRLEVVQADGAVTRVDLPYDVLTPLWEYLQPWLYLRSGEDRVEP